VKEFAELCSGLLEDEDDAKGGEAPKMFVMVGAGHKASENNMFFGVMVVFGPVVWVHIWDMFVGAGEVVFRL